MPGSRSKERTSAVLLLIDNSRNGLSARKKILEEDGYTVHAHSSVERAIRASSEHAPNIVVLCDDSCESPQTITNLRDHELTAPLVLISGIADSAGFTTKSTGADAVVQKSAQEIVELLRIVQRLTRSRAARKRPVGSASAVSKTARKRA